MDTTKILHIIKAGESETVEFKKSTAHLSRAGETLCAFLNRRGGRVFIGVTPEGKVVGQQVTDSTLRDIASMTDRFEPPAPIEIRIIDLEVKGKNVIVLDAPTLADSRPFSFNGRPYQRVGSTTSVMPQNRYESLLLDRAHARRRW